MSGAPIGAVIRYWLHPRRNCAYIHRIEVEHALYLAAASQEQIKDTLTEVLRGQTESLGSIAYSLHALRDEVAAGFSEVCEGLASVDHTLHGGFYQLHLDALGTHKRLDDLLLLMCDKDAHRRELAARHAAAEARRGLYQASSEYGEALALTQRALNESVIAKAGAMLDEAIALFGRASHHPDFEIEAHFQLAYLAQQHGRDLELAYDHYGKGLGTGYSSHFVRTARHLAHLDYLTGSYGSALERMMELIAHDDAIKAFARDLQEANVQPWENNACIHALEDALSRHEPLLQRCSRLNAVRRQFEDQRRFSATERFMESHSSIMEELRDLRPDMRVYYDASRYAIRAGHAELALPWIKHCYNAQPTVSGRRVFLLEAMADEDLRNA